MDKLKTLAQAVVSARLNMRSGSGAPADLLAAIDALATEINSPKYRIVGRRWFQRGPGNTYHSVTIFRDGEQIAYLPFAYGYGDQYIQTALDWLEDNGRIPARIPHPATGGKESGTRYLREVLGIDYEVHDVDRKKDL